MCSHKKDCLKVHDERRMSCALLCAYFNKVANVYSGECVVWILRGVAGGVRKVQQKWWIEPPLAEWWIDGMNFHGQKEMNMADISRTKRETLTPTLSLKGQGRKRIQAIECQCFTEVCITKGSVEKSGVSRLFTTFPAVKFYTFLHFSTCYEIPKYPKYPSLQCACRGIKKAQRRIRKYQTADAIPENLETRDENEQV